jgi:hypothetical protein
MVLVDGREQEELLSHAEEAFPREVEFVISALAAGLHPEEDRHHVARTSYRVRATLKLFSDQADVPPTLLYVRDVSTQAAGFLSARPVTLSHGGIMRIRSRKGEMMQVYCTVLRCREAAPGWYEGAVYFNREQGALGVEGG